MNVKEVREFDLRFGFYQANLLGTNISREREEYIERCLGVTIRSLVWLKILLKREGVVRIFLAQNLDAPLQQNTTTTTASIKTTTKELVLTTMHIIY